MRINSEDLRPVGHTVTLLALLVANLVAALWFPIACVLTAPVAGFAMCCALSAVHECSHRTYFFKRRANDVFGRFWALIILMNFSAYRRDHMLHHRHQGGDRDTEPRIVVHSRWDLAKSIISNPHVIPSWIWSARVASGFVRSTKPARIDAIALILFQAVLLIFAALDPFLFTIAYAVPFLTFTIMDNIVSLPEHVLIGGDATKPITRSMTVSEPFSFLLYCVNRHIEHHSRPAITAHKLDHDIDVRQAPAVSYLEFYVSLWSHLSRETPGHAV